MAASLQSASAPVAALVDREAPGGAAARGWARIDAFLAPQLDRFGTDELRRARLVVVACGTIGLISVLTSANLAAHATWGNLPVTLGVLLLVALAPWLLRRTGSLALCGNLLAGIVALAMAALMLNAGGATVPPFILLPGVPLIAALIAGPAWGLGWSAAALALLISVYVLAVRGLEPAIELNPDHVFRGRYVGSGMMVLFVLLIAQAYERLKTRALDEVSEARRLAELRSREVEETRRQQLELKDRFLSHVSHELRTPLAALHQFLSLVLDGLAGEVPDEQRDYLAAASRNAEQLTRMIDDLMDLNRARNGKLRVEDDLVPPAPLLRDIASGLEARAADKKVQIQARLPESLPTVRADAARVRQVVGNLAENAIKFTPAGGVVQIDAEIDPADETVLRVSVQDTGCGIASDAVERIFDRLHQERTAETESRLGLGLGLPIAKELVERQGGRIWAESRPGEGSTFRFTLPIFSLARALQPCVVEDGRLLPVFSVLRVEMRSPDGGATDSLRRGVLHVLRSTVFYPERDVVFPPGAADESANRFTLVVSTGLEGVRALSGRLGERLDRFARDRGRDEVAFYLRASTQRVSDSLSAAPVEQALEELAQRVGIILREIDRQGGTETCSQERS